MGAERAQPPLALAQYHMRVCDWVGSPLEIHHACRRLVAAPQTCLAGQLNGIARVALRFRRLCSLYRKH